MGFQRAVWALFRRDLAERLSYKTAAVMDLASIAAHALVFFFVARLVPGAAIPSLAAYGGQYFPFTLVGIAFANYHAAALTGFSQALSREQDGGTLEMIWMTPTGLPGLMIAGWAWEFLWATGRVLAYLAAGAIIFGAGLLKPAPLPAAAALVMMVCALSGLGLLSAAFLLVYKRGDPVSALLNGATRLLSGVYFPLALLPLRLRPFSLMLPFTFALEALRKALLQGLGFGAISKELTVLALWTLISLPLGLWVFAKAVDRARRDGSLALR